VAENARAIIRALIRSGHIDCLHSFGDLAITREAAARALDELDQHGCRLGVWVDHGSVPTNFGADIMCGTGDVSSSPSYHADLTCAFGVRYVWVLDPKAKRAWVWTSDGMHPVRDGVLRTAGPEIAVPLSALFEV
jgi:hypothetical protein